MATIRRHPTLLFTNMKGFFIFIVTLLFHVNYLSAQRHDNTLVFGYAGGKFSPDDDGFGLNILTFPEGSLHLSDNQTSPLNVFNTCTSISDSLGRLLFYTNGIHIEDSDFKTMAYGRNITPLC